MLHPYAHPKPRRAGAPFLVTPKVTREDLEKVDGNFRYVVE